jgi:hypothetical protein
MRDNIVTDLEERIRHIEDLESIRLLKHYNYCDRAVAGDAAAIEETVSRFSDDVVADFTGFPLAEGRDAVTDFYARAVPAMLSYSQHYVFNEVIDIDGDCATGLWYVNCPVIFTDASPLGREAPGLIAGRYEEEYIRENGVWKWRRVVALLDVLNPSDQLWANATLLRANR